MGSSFGFGFGSLPSLDSMELDSNFSGTDIDFNDDHKHDASMTKEEATEMLKDAVDLDAMRDVLRSNIVYLNEQMAKNEDLFKSIPDIVSIIMNAANGKIFDCWIIKTYLGLVSKLISCSAAIPSDLLSTVKGIQSKWSNVVKNVVGSGVVFEFFPSQQIVKNCSQIIEQLQ